MTTAPAKPNTLHVQLEHIPPGLKELRRWVGWRWTFNPNKPSGHHQGWDKPPMNPNTGGLAKSDDPATWGSYQQGVCFMEQESLDGIGIMLLELDNTVTHDLDNCRNPETGEVSPQAMNIVRLVGGYWEITPSGTGIRGLAYGKKTGSRVEASRGGPIDGAQYDGSKGRYVTLTGHRLPESTEGITDAHPGGIEAAYALMFPQRQQARTGPVPGPATVDPDDTTLVRKARAARNGERFSRLWEGDSSGYQSQSEADLALCSLLAFWTGRDADRVDALFRQSGLMDEKWERDDYRTRTIHKALERSEFYQQSAENYTPTPASVNGVHESVAPSPGEPYHLTDMGNAKRLVARHGASIRFCWPWGCWLVWDGRRWAKDTIGAVVSLAKDTMAGIYTEAAANTDSDSRSKLGKWAVQSESESRIAAMVNLARSEPGIPIIPAALDADPWVLNVSNGVLDLRTGELSPHDPARLLTKLSPVDFDPAAAYQLWDDFLESAIPDWDTRRYVQKIAGMSLTGDASEDLIVLVHGPGGTGKGTLRGAIASALGTDYAATADLATFANKRDPHGPQPDLARLAGVRLVTVSEVEAGGAMALLKRVTGGDPIQTRSHHQETFEFIPQFTLWLMANDRPQVPDTDTGIWRRIREIPFTTVFNPPDPTVRQCLADPEAAGPAVLAWAVAGCLAWLKEGLGHPPGQVATATAEYRAEMDPLADFLEDCTVAIPNAWTSSAELWSNYQTWCDCNKVKPISRNALFKRLVTRFTKDDKHQRDGGRGFRGVGLTAEP